MASIEVVAVDVGAPQARDAVAAYFDELADRFDTGFDAARGGADHDAAALRPPTGAFFVVTDADDVVGCGGLQRHDDDTAEIKRMWIDPARRGGGLGRRLLAHLEDAAVGLGYRSVVLDTNSTLTEAIAMYERAGYRSIERYNDNPYAQRWFTKDLPF